MLFYFIYLFFSYVYMYVYNSVYRYKKKKKKNLLPRFAGICGKKKKKMYNIQVTYRSMVVNIRI